MNLQLQRRIMFLAKVWISAIRTPPLHKALAQRRRTHPNPGPFWEEDAATFGTSKNGFLLTRRGTILGRHLDSDFGGRSRRGTARGGKRETTHWLELLPFQKQVPRLVRVIRFHRHGCRAKKGLLLVLQQNASSYCWWNNLQCIAAVDGSSILTIPARRSIHRKGNGQIKLGILQ